jgi:hypothetical protein
MRLHSSAQLRHACAHLLQWSTLCLSHSLAQASQMSAHMLQNCFANWLSIDIREAEVQQTIAHSRLICAQPAIIFTSCSLRSEVAQNSHASAHLIQASMQLCHFVFWSVAVAICKQSGTCYLRHSSFFSCLRLRLYSPLEVSSLSSLRASLLILQLLPLREQVSHARKAIPLGGQ